MLLACCTGILSAQVKNAESVQSLGNGSTAGTDFWIAIPPNDLAPFSSNTLDIYVASEFNTKVRLYDALNARGYEYTVEAGRVLTLSSGDNETSWSWEVREFERPVHKGIRITSDLPITVYVLNSKLTSSEGFLALPTIVWSTEYVVSSYSDFSEQKAWTGGFCIVASEQNTQVAIALKGQGKGLANTSGGRALGDTIHVTLNEGDVYAVTGDGKTKAEFDLTGTSILSTKPVGLLCFHQRTTIPNLLINGNGRNHLVEMTLPVNRWSNKYVSVEYNRQGTNPAGRGDMFRVVASQPDTRFSYWYYDKNSKEFVGSGGGVLAGAGDFIDVTSTQVPVILPYGYSIWEADKPILVTQLSTSATFDGDDQHDPFMVHVTPVSHATTSTVFQTPTGTQFDRHNLNLIVQTDSSSAVADAHLRSIEIDGIPLYDHPGTVGSPLLNNHMGGGLYWATISLNTEIRSHQITSNGNASFIGYIYGYGNVDSYGWPIGYGRALNTRSIDTMPPFLVRLPEEEDTSLYLVEFAAYEIRNLPRQPRNPPERTDQVETGISSIFIRENLPSNLELILRTDDRFPGDKPHTAFRFAVRTIDSTEAGSGTIVVRDFAGNTSYYPITIDAPIRPSMKSVDFGMTILETRPEKAIHITNPTPFTVNVTNIRLRAGEQYDLRTDRPLPLDLDSGDVVTAYITYRSERETKNYRTDWDLDTMFIFTPLVDARIPIKGVAGIPHCSIDNILYGVVTAGGRPACREVSVRNTGSFPLYIHDISGYEGTDFTFQLYPGALADPVEPFKDRALGLGCYVPDAEGHDTALIRLTVNATRGNDTTATWFGSTSGALVLEERSATDLTITELTSGLLSIGFNVGPTGSLTVWNLEGILLCSQAIDAGITATTLSTDGWAAQPVIIVLRQGSHLVSRLLMVGG